MNERIAPAMELSMHDSYAASKPRRLGALVAVITVTLALGGVFLLLQRASAARSQRAASELREFSARAEALQAELGALHGKLGHAQSRLGEVQTRAAQQRAADEARRRSAARDATASPAAAPDRSRTTRAARADQPRRQRAAPERPESPRPGKITLSERCTNSPLGC